MRSSFSRRYGYEPLPEPMRLEELSSDLRREIWNAVREVLVGKRDGVSEYYYFHAPDERFVERVLGANTKTSEDEIPTEYDHVCVYLKNSVLNHQFNQVLDLIEIMVNDRDITEDFVKRMNNSFEQYAAAYWLDTSQQPYRFVPRGSKEQGEATQQAIETICENNFDGAAGTSPSSDRTPQCATIRRFNCR